MKKPYRFKYKNAEETGLKKRIDNLVEKRNLQ